MDIDTVLGTATPEVATNQPASTEATSETPEIENKVETEAPAKVEEDVSKKLDSELTPEQLAKREKNRQSHLNSKLAEMRRQNRELQAKLSQQQPKPQEQSPQNGKPRIEDFADKTWEEYNEALTDWKLEQKFSAQNKQTSETQQSQQINNAKAQRAQAIAIQEAEFAKATPEYADLVNENAAFFSGITPEIAEGLAEADNPTVAIYALMKEGGLDNLFDLTPTKLAAELAKAEIRGESYLKQPKPTTNAPAPKPRQRGNVVSKSLDKLDGAALLKSLRSN